MPEQFTFAMIKPHAVADKHTGSILQMIEHANFHISALQHMQMTPEQAADFYAMHQGKPFFQQLCQVMASGPVVAMILEKEHAVAEFRRLIGATNPAEAAEGTIRKRFGKELSANAIHGSDSPEAAITEIRYFFPNARVA